MTSRWRRSTVTSRPAFSAVYFTRASSRDARVSPAIPRQQRSMYAYIRPFHPSPFLLAIPAILWYVAHTKLISATKPVLLCGRPSSALPGVGPFGPPLLALAAGSHGEISSAFSATFGNVPESIMCHHDRAAAYYASPEFVLVCVAPPFNYRPPSSPGASPLSW